MSDEWGEKEKEKEKEKDGVLGLIYRNYGADIFQRATVGAGYGGALGEISVLSLHRRQIGFRAAEEDFIEGGGAADGAQAEAADLRQLR